MYLFRPISPKKLTLLKQKQNTIICKRSVFPDNGFTKCSWACAVISFYTITVFHSHEPWPILAFKWLSLSRMPLSSRVTIEPVYLHAECPKQMLSEHFATCLKCVAYGARTVTMHYETANKNSVRWKRTTLALKHFWYVLFFNLPILLSCFLLYFFVICFQYWSFLFSIFFFLYICLFFSDSLLSRCQYFFFLSLIFSSNSLSVFCIIKKNRLHLSASTVCSFKHQT